jgi:hypothetical protein
MYIVAGRRFSFDRQELAQVELIRSIRFKLSLGFTCCELVVQVELSHAVVGTSGAESCCTQL